MSLGLSAQAISGDGYNHPHDPSDLQRCVNYCDGRITTEELQARMAGRSVEWDLLLPEWDRLVELLKHEKRTRTDRMAPLTYNEMKRVIHDGITCGTCRGTGRGDECEKCKGTGRRTGGTCRADRCHRGATFCPECRGQGFNLRDAS